jgi:RNA polymerase sigma-70 factor (ECF subfamily)
MASDPSAAALLQAAQAGDREAALGLLERYRDSIYRFGMRMCADAVEAQDVLQETLLAAAEALPGFRGEAALSSWLYTIARSACVRRRRGAARHDALDPQTLVDSALQPEEALSRQQLRSLLDRALSSLDPEYREVLQLRDVEGLTGPEVATTLELSVPAMKSRLHRARQMLRERIEGLLQPGPRCPDVVAWLSQRLQEDLTPDRCAELEARLARCGDPGGELDPLLRMLGACRLCETRQVPEELEARIRSHLIRAIARRG